MNDRMKNLNISHFVPGTRKDPGSEEYMTDNMISEGHFFDVIFKKSAAQEGWKWGKSEFEGQH